MFSKHLRQGYALDTDAIEPIDVVDEFYTRVTETLSNIDKHITNIRDRQYLVLDLSQTIVQ